MVAGWYLLACQSKFASMLKSDQSSWKRFSQLFRNLVQVFLYLVLKWTNQILYSIWHSGGVLEGGILFSLHSLPLSVLGSHYLFYSCFWKLRRFKVFITKTFYSFTSSYWQTKEHGQGIYKVGSRVDYSNKTTISPDKHILFSLLHISTRLK